MSRVIPQSAKIYLAAIQCDYLNKSNGFRREYDGKTFKFNCLDNASMFKTNLNGNFEPYTTENLNQLDFKLLCDPVELDDIHIRFDDLNFLEKYCKQNEIRLFSKKLNVKTEGYLDAFVIWFDLNLGNYFFEFFYFSIIPDLRFINSF